MYPYAPPPFKALPELMKSCAFYFGNDNGIRHAAIIAGLATATLFGPPDPLYWTPLPDPKHVYIWGKDNLDQVSEKAVIDMISRVFP